MRGRHLLAVLAVAAAASFTLVPAASADINYGPCTLRAIGPNTGFDGNFRWGEGRARISCVSPYFISYQICTQKKTSVFVLEEQCSSRSWLFSAGQTIWPVGPRLRDGFPLCYGVNWASRIKAYGGSHTSASYC